MDTATQRPPVVLSDEPIVSVRGLTKRFGDHQVLHGIDLDIRGGEVLVLLGPNGAGKSTFLNIIGGSLEPSEGEVAIGGAPISPSGYDSRASRGQGIERVFQELSTFPNLTVAENLALTSKTGARLSSKDAVRRAQERLAAFPDAAIAADTPVGALSIAERQIVEIVRAMTEDDVRLVILDEPTSALSAREAEQLARLIERKVADGVAVVYVTHKLEEALGLADRIVVLRDGRLYHDGAGRGRSHEELLELLGATLEVHPTARPAGVASDRAKLLTLDNLSSGRLHNIDFHVCEGEVVGLAGLEGAGQRDLLQAVFDARGVARGAIKSSTDMAYVSGDRKAEGLLPLWSVEQNVAVSAAPRMSRMGFVDFGALKTTAQSWLAELGLTEKAADPITSLSGGNQQRALLGRALASEAPLLLLDDPTRGVDAAAKAAIYETLDRVKAEGRSAILYSTEVAEFARCDRVYVMARGHVVAEFDGATVREDQIVQASFLQPQGEPATRLDPAAARLSKGRIERVLGWSALPATLLMTVLLGFTFAQAPNALSPFGLDILLQASVPLALAIMAQLLFLQAGDLDLGLGFAIGLANAIAATYLADSPAFAVLALSGVIVGYVLLALMVELLGVSSVVATLGASFVWLGLGLMILESPGGQSPEWLTAVVQLKLWPLPLACYLLVAVALLGSWLCRGWRYSVRLRALGENRQTYVALGFSALRGRVVLYALSGAFAVMAGLYLTGVTGAGNVHVASSFTLATIAAAVVGGASFAGGRVAPAGAVMAVVAISLIGTNLGLLGVRSEYSTAISGLALIAALSFRPASRQRAS